MTIETAAPTAVPPAAAPTGSGSAESGAGGAGEIAALRADFARTQAQLAGMQRTIADLRKPASPAPASPPAPTVPANAPDPVAAQIQQTRDALDQRNAEFARMADGLVTALPEELRSDVPTEADGYERYRSATRLQLLHAKVQATVIKSTAAAGSTAPAGAAAPAAHPAGVMPKAMGAKELADLPAHELNSILAQTVRRNGATTTR